MSKLAVWLYTLTYRGVGGWERYVKNLLKYLPRYGVNIFVIDTTHSGLVLQNLNQIKGIMKLPFEPISRLSIYLDYLSVWLHSFSRRTSIDILHIPSQADLHLKRLVRAKKYVITVHGLSFALLGGLTSHIKAKLLCKIVKSVDAIIAVSNWVKNLIMRYLTIPEYKIHVVYHCVDRNIFNEAKINFDDVVLARLGLSSKSYFLHVSSGNPLKNPKIIIDAANMLDLRSKGIKLVFVGLSDPYKKMLLEYAYCKGMGDIVLALPAIQCDKILAVLYRNALAFILPSFIETFSFTLAEAMSCGTVCIVSRRGALPEIGGEAAIYIDPKNSRELAYIMSEILKGKIDVMNKLGIERAKRLFSPENFAKGHLRVYKSVSS